MKVTLRAFQDHMIVVVDRLHIFDDVKILKRVPSDNHTPSNYRCVRIDQHQITSPVFRLHRHPLNAPRAPLSQRPQHDLFRSYLLRNHGFATLRPLCGHTFFAIMASLRSGHSADIPSSQSWWRLRRYQPTAGTQATSRFFDSQNILWIVSTAAMSSSAAATSTFCLVFEHNLVAFQMVACRSG